jgi:tetratricopeptide (TPR) repeat protein
MYREAIEQQRITRGDTSPAFIQLQSALANLLVAAGKMTEAEALFRQGLEMQPNSAVELWNGWADYLVSQHKYTAAVDAYTEVIRQKPDDAPAWRKRGDAHLLLGQPEKALADENKSIELDPTNAWAWQSRALVYMRSQQLERALSDYNSAIGLNPDVAQFLLQRADCWTKLGEPDKAYEDRANVIALREKNLQKATPDQQGSRSNELAWALATVAEPKLRDAKRAVELAQKAVQLRPSDRARWNTLGVAHYRAGDFHEALAALEKSMQLGVDGDAVDWFFLAMAYWQLGDKDEARTWYDKAVEWTDKNKPHNEELTRFRTECAALLGIAETQDPKP